jgi:hypothetical protein
MPHDWRKELRKHQKVRELTQRLALRKQELNEDKQFLIETERLRAGLTSAVTKHRMVLPLFFKKFSYPVGPRLPTAKQFVSGRRNKALKKLLNDYLSYVARFGVRFQLRAKRPRFLLEYLIPWGAKFHVRLVRDHFEPVEGYPGGDVPYEDYFEADRMEVPTGLEQLVKSRKAKFVLIEDGSCSSILSKLEYFASFTEGLTFVVHNAERPYCLCLIGENVSDKDWKRASRAHSALLREYFDRGKGGRPPNIPRLRHAIKLRKRPGLLKTKITPRGDLEKHLRSEQSYSSRVGAAVRP